MSKNYHFLNTLSIITTGFILTLCYWSRMDMLSFMSTFNYISIFALATTIFSLPDFLYSYLPSNNKWYRNNEFYTSLLLIFLGIGGIILEKYTARANFIIVPIGIALAFWELFQFIQLKKWLALSAGVAFMGLIILLFYSNDVHSTLFPEKIILGKAHIDTLFHSSLSNMFSTLGWPSSGLDGAPYFNYHWGSHALFGGLKNWADLNTLMFYNIAYPAIFIPLFFKSLFSFLNRLFIYKGISSFNILFAISIITVMYSLTVAGFQNAQPLSSESFCVSLIFTFLYASSLLSFISQSNKISNLFFWYSVITLLLISFFKISTGFVSCAGMAYAVSRNRMSTKNLLAVFIGGAIIVLLVYVFVFPKGRIDIHISLEQRIYSLWLFSESFITYLLGAFIAIVVVIKNKPLKNWGEWKSIIISREYIDLEILFVVTMSGFLGAIAASSNASDPFYFCMTQFYISILYLILFGQKYFDGFRPSNRVKNLFLFLVTILSLASRPDLLKIRGGFLEIIQLKKEMLSLTHQQQILKDFIIALYKLEKESDKKTKCVYIPQTEKWFYESQTDYLRSSSMVVPAISGIALIAGIPDGILQSNFSDYSFNYYKKDRQPPVNSLTDAKNKAFKEGYHELIEYHSSGGKLVKRTFNLKKHK